MFLRIVFLFKIFSLLLLYSASIELTQLYDRYVVFRSKLLRSIPSFENAISYTHLLSTINQSNPAYNVTAASLRAIEKEILLDYDYSMARVRVSDSVISHNCFNPTLYDIKYDYIRCDRSCGTVRLVNMYPFELFQPDIQCAIALRPTAYAPRCRLPLECNDIVENVSLSSQDLIVCYGRRIQVNRFVPKYKRLNSTDVRFSIFCNESVRFSVPNYLLDAPETLKSMFVTVNGSFAYFHDKGYAEIFSYLDYRDISEVKVSKYKYVCDDFFYARYPQGFLDINVFRSHRGCYLSDRGICYDAYRDSSRCPDDYRVSRHDSTALWRLFRLFIWENQPFDSEYIHVSGTSDPDWYEPVVRLLRFYLSEIIKNIYSPLDLMLNSILSVLRDIPVTMNSISDRWYQLLSSGIHIPAQVILRIIEEAYRMVFRDPLSKKFYFDLNKQFIDYFINSTRVDQYQDGIFSWLFSGFIEIFKPIMKIFISFISEILDTVITYLLFAIPLYENLITQLAEKIIVIIRLLSRLLQFLFRILACVLIAVDHYIMVSEYLFLYVIFTMKFRNNLVAALLLVVFVLVFGLTRHHPSFLLSIINPEFKNISAVVHFV